MTLGVVATVVVAVAVLVTVVLTVLADVASQALQSAPAAPHFVSTEQEKLAAALEWFTRNVRSGDCSASCPMATTALSGSPLDKPAEDGQGHQESAGGAGVPAACTRSPLMEEVAALLATEADRVIAALRDSPAPSSHSEPESRRVSALERVVEAARKMGGRWRTDYAYVRDALTALDALTSDKKEPDRE